MKPGLLKVDRQHFAEMANTLVPLHATYGALGLRLVLNKPFIHVSERGLITARFVYRGECATVTYVAKRVQVEWV
jgi:hypothetical protein